MKVIAKGIITILMLCLLLAIPASAAWNTNGIFVDPSAGTILADTGPVSVGLHTYTIAWSTGSAGLLELQHRNATDTATLHTQEIFMNVSSNVYLIPITLLVNERVRVVMKQAWTPCSCTLQISIFD